MAKDPLTGPAFAGSSQEALGESARVLEWNSGRLANVCPKQVYTLRAEPGAVDRIQWRDHWKKNAVPRQ